MYESENQALSTHPDFFDPIHKSAEVVMIAGDENYARVVYRDERQSCLLYTPPSPRDVEESRRPSSA